MTRQRRTSGRDYRAVRRYGQPARVVESIHTVQAVDPSSMKKPELVAYAAEQGVETTGTKADIVERLETETTDDS